MSLRRKSAAPPRLLAIQRRFSSTDMHRLTSVKDFISKVKDPNMNIRKSPRVENQLEDILEISNRRLKNYINNDTVPTDDNFYPLTVRLVEQSFPKGDPERWELVKYTSFICTGKKPSLNVLSKTRNNFGYAIGLFVPSKELPDTFSLRVVISLDDVRIERVDELSFSIKQVNDTTNTKEFIFRCSSPKSLENWLIFLKQISNYKYKILICKQSKCYDQQFKKKCHFSKKVDLASLLNSHEKQFWILTAGTIADCLEWTLFSCKHPETDYYEIEGLLIFSVTYSSFSFFFSKFSKVWKKHNDPKNKPLWVSSFQYFCEQLVRSYAILSVADRESVIQFCDSHLIESATARMRSYITEFSFVSSFERLVKIHQVNQIVPEWGSDKEELLTILTISSKDLAEQLTLIEALHHSEMKIEDFLSKTTKQNALQLATDWWNKMSNWVATEILLLPNMKQQIRIMRKFIKVSHLLFSMKNYSSCCQILSGLNHNVIQRLKRLQVMLPLKYINLLCNLSSVFSHEANYAAYRKLIENDPVPSLKFLPVHQRDLTFIIDGNPQYADENGKLINFERTTMIANCFRQIGITQPLESFDFKIQPNTAIQTFLQNAKPLPEEELYQLSTKQEPLKTSGAGEPEPPQQGEVVCRNPLFQNSNLATLIKREKSNPS